MNQKEAVEILMSNPDASLRNSAAKELAVNNVFDTDVIGALAKGIQDEDNGVKDICFMALSNIPDSDANQAAMAISPLIASDNIELRNLAGDILTNIGELSVNSLLPFLNDDDAQVIQFALDVLGNIGSEEINEYFFPLLNSENINVVSSAIDGLGKFKSESALDELNSIYDRDEDLKPMIISAYSKIGGKKAEEILLRLLKEEEDIFIQTAVIDALAFAGEDPSICDDLLIELPKQDKEIQVILLKTIYGIAFRKEIEIVLPDEFRYVAQNALFDSDEDVRGAGLIALGNVYQASDILALINEILSLNHDTQQMILYNLLSFSNPSVVKNFFISYYSKCLLDQEHIEFFSMLKPIWANSTEENAYTTIKTLIAMVLNKKPIFSDEIFYILLSLDREKFIAILKDFLPSKGIGRQSEILELTRKYQLYELKDDISDFLEETRELARDVANTLDSLSENTNANTTVVEK